MLYLGQVAVVNENLTSTSPPKGEIKKYKKITKNRVCVWGRRTMMEKKNTFESLLTLVPEGVRS